MREEGGCDMWRSGEHVKKISERKRRERGKKKKRTRRLQRRTTHL
jgi:hypothetical protein